MISSAYVVEMSRYNMWQNNQIMEFLDALDEAAITLDRGAFCGSILGTLNHLLWGDRMWMSRWSDVTAKPAQTMEETTRIMPTSAEWQVARRHMDKQILAWATSLDPSRLTETLTWHSVAANADFSKPFADCVVHFFNHQTHHRGQVHAMLTAAGSKAPVSDIPFMPEEV